MVHTSPLHPRPQRTREGWRTLDGFWDFAFDDEARWRDPAEVVFDSEIRVPFCPESVASGLNNTTYHKAVWYRRTLVLEHDERQGRLLLHFGAVDYQARVWVNGALLVEHQGGHTPFYADLTSVARAHERLEVVVCAEDDPHDLAIPRGKQDWLPEPHAIWYPRTTGIWQSVWLEKLPEISLDSVRWTPHLERWELGLEVKLGGNVCPNLMLRVRLSSQGEELAEDHYKFMGNVLERRINLLDPGIDSARSELLWSPESPRLIEATLELLEGDTVIDQVGSYTAMRSVGVEEGRFILNGRPYFLRMVLDQGYWPDSLMTAPDDAALRRDVELTKMLGFNGARKHQKIEDPHWLFWCDTLGLLVWEEMPSAYRYSPQSVQRLMGEWLEVLERDYSHPCIIAWVPFNESWGVPDLPRNSSHRHLVRGFYHTTKALDPSRLTIGNDGWENVAGDLLTVHDYAQNPKLLLERYGNSAALARTLREVQPGSHLIHLADFEPEGKPVMLSEFGGTAFSLEESRGWGYHRVQDAEAFAAQYSALLGAVHDCNPSLAGFCYTQLTDTFQEKNGLLTFEREFKAPVSVLSSATIGKRNTWELDHDPEPDPLGYSLEWRARQKRLAQTLPLPSK